MAKVWIIQHPELPAPSQGYDLVIWPATELPSPTQLRTWAGWSETYLVAGDLDLGQILAFRPLPEDWPDTLLAVGSGRVWRFQDRYIAWLTNDDLMIPEIPRALALAGVDLIISGARSLSDPYLDPLWRAIQANQIYGLALGAEPRLYLPCELDSAEMGVAPMEPAQGGAAVEIDFGRLMEARRLYPVRQQLRPQLYKSERWWSS